MWYPSRRSGSHLCFLLLMWVQLIAGVRSIDPDHAGVCPNHVNANLWVDAQSTCERECQTDQDCAAHEKCCINVCGLLSCVAARFSDGSSADGQSGGGLLSGGEANCNEFVCSQQGAVCDVWEGQLICKCHDRCEKEPSFTCASDGLTYFNRCYMDAEACVQGVTLTEVTCRYHLSGPNASPLPQDTTAHPTPTASHADSFPPTLYSNPQHQVIYLGGTASFHCDVIGHPKPDITWEKQSEVERLTMRPDQMYGNVVITNIGQLVVYNAQIWDAGIYTCIARNGAGTLRANYPLSVVKRNDDDFFDEPGVSLSIGRPFSPSDCTAAVERGECGEKRVDWFYDAAQGSCQTFTHGGCEGGRNRFETYEECRASCQREGLEVCSLPAVQGPCKHWEVRWTYNCITERCQAFVYGGCHGNRNNFRTRRDCETSCPRSSDRQCRSCRTRGKIVESLCRSDFAIVGRLTELIEDLDSGIARFYLEQVLRDEKMGLRLFKTQNLEVMLMRMDWSCPCPNVTQHQELPLLVMGEVQDGVAVILPHSYVRPISDRRLKKIHEVLAKKTCEMLQRFKE
ncbi:WAP, Kazal, immunoglobulin, Kunitz and NTR domain-containing protein [Misgurnus anguillicaudatus]|uniref:WAP, Kazal, immunoglobulin, Kunitz and NTR domain-containing protein n=1 Tax=Misgurnus anguillicaudatus TaxID=75329 RepID=UPI003CCF1149